jgi:hypothetical protein
MPRQFAIIVVVDLRDTFEEAEAILSVKVPLNIFLDAIKDIPGVVVDSSWTTEAKATPASNGAKRGRKSRAEKERETMIQANMVRTREAPDNSFSV